MTWYVHSFIFKGANDREVTRRYGNEVTEIVTGDSIAAEVIKHNALATALLAVTDAVINESFLQIKVRQEDDLGAGDVSEQAVLVYDLDVPSDSSKTANHTLPAPSQGIFMATTGSLRDVIDISDNDLLALSTELVLYEISDGETIDDTVGASGLLKGYRRTVAWKPNS